MQRRIPTLFLVVVLFVLHGCATTRLDSQLNHEYVGMRLAVVMAEGRFQDVEYRRTAERALCEQIERYTQCACVQSIELLSPGREYSKEEYSRLLEEAGVEAILVLEPTGGGVTAVHVPEATYLARAKARDGGNRKNLHTKTAPFGRTNVKEPWATYEATMWSVENSEVVWSATARTNGTNLSSVPGLIRSASQKVVGRIVSDGIFGSVE